MTSHSKREGRVISLMTNKFGAKKVKTPDGKVFDSKKEAQRYGILRLLERAGKIADLQLQVKFVLIPTQKDEKGKVIERECSYVADFVYYENGNKVVEDTKGFKTADYILKRKLMLWVHGIRIKET